MLWYGNNHACNWINWDRLNLNLNNFETLKILSNNILVNIFLSQLIWPLPVTSKSGPVYVYFTVKIFCINGRKLDYLPHSSSYLVDILNEMKISAPMSAHPQPVQLFQRHDSKPFEACLQNITHTSLIFAIHKII